MFVRMDMERTPREFGPESFMSTCVSYIFGRIPSTIHYRPVIAPHVSGMSRRKYAPQNV